MRDRETERERERQIEREREMIIKITDNAQIVFDRQRLPINTFMKTHDTPRYSQMRGGGGGGRVNILATRQISLLNKNAIKPKIGPPLTIFPKSLDPLQAILEKTSSTTPWSLCYQTIYRGN